MPYISTEQIAEKRKAIKLAFPNWKFSITRRHYSSINVVILETDIKLTEKDYEGVNHYYIKDHYKDNTEVAEALQKIVDIMEGNNEIVSIDGDYGAIPKFYTSLSIGEWDKPFKYIPKTELPKKPTNVKVEPIENDGKIKVVDYSEKAIAIIGDTKPIKDTLKALGGRFNFRLTCGAGWIFPKTKEAEIRSVLQM